MSLNNKKNFKPPNTNKLFLVISVIAFALISVFGLSLITGNQDQTNIGSSNASSTEPADINNDNKVDVFDLSILLSKWGTNNTTSDLNKDGTTNVFDLSMLLSKWGSVTTEPPIANTAYERGLAWYQQNTGVPSGTVLTTVGSLNINTDGTIVDGRDVNGSIVVNAKNVIIRNTKVRGPIENNAGADANLLIEYTEVDMTGIPISQQATGQYRGFAVWEGATLRNVRGHGMAQAVTIANYVTIEDSYFYGIRTNTVHAENILSNGGGNNIIRRNWLDSSDPTGQMAISGALCMYGDFDRVHDVVIDGNYLIGNAGYLFYPGAVRPKVYPLPYNISVTNNVINPTQGSYGAVYPSSLDTLSESKWSNNKYPNGTPIPAPQGNN